MIKKDSKIQEELQRELGLDDPTDKFRAIVEFYPSMVDVASLASVGAAIVNVSRTVPLITVEATADQFLAIEKIPSVKKIWYNAPVSITLHNYLPYDALTEPKVSDVQITLSDTVNWIRADKTNGITGKGVKVAVLDTGVNSSHPMLQGKVSAKFQVVDGNIEDGLGHGTWCASCIAGNFIDSPAGPLRGVAPDATIINGKVLADDGSGFIDGIIQGMEKAVIDYKADIVSMSLGRPFDCDSPMWQTVDSLIQQYGVMFAIAAGNNGPQNSPSDPGTASRAITVAATSIRVGGGDQVAGFSSRGPSIHKNIYPNVSAPGGAGGGDQLNEYIYGPWGTGYNWVRGTCLSGNTNVYTTDGPVEISKLEIGDKIYSYDNGTLVQRKVNKIMNQGKKKTFKILTSNKRCIYATDNHPFLSFDKGNLVWKPVSELKEKDIILATSKIPENIEPLINSVISEDIALALGYFMAEGWISRNRNYQIDIAEGDKPRDKAMIELSKRAFGIDFKLNNKGRWYYVYSKRLAFALRLLGFGEKHKIIELPKWIYQLSHEKIKAFIRGFVLGDGWEEKGKDCYRIEIASEKLAFDLKKLCEYVGIKSGLVRTKIRKTNAPNAVDKNKMNRSFLLFMNFNGYTSGHSFFEIKNSQSKLSTLLNTEILHLTSIKSIEENVVEDVYDIEVEESHNFIAEGLVVHNSMATPHVAGLLALLQQKKGSRLTEAEVKNILSKSSVNGHPNDTGWGRIDCVNALNFSLPPVQEAFGSGLSGFLTAGLIGGLLLSGGIKNDRR